MNLWFNNKKNAVLALRRLFRDGVDMKQFDRSEVRVEPVADPAARGPSRVTKSYRQGQGWQQQRHESGLGYHLVLPRPLSMQHAGLLLKWASQQPGGRPQGYGFSRSASERATLYNWRKGRAYVNDALLKKAYVYEPPRLKEEIRNMDGMLQRQKPLVRPITVYRGVGARIEHKVGDVFKMPQYVSTTRSKYVAATVFTNVARHVYNERHGYKEGYDTKAPNGTFYRIICVPGTRVLNPGNDKIAELKSGSMQELILPRGQEFRVVSKDGVNAYTLETIPQQGYSFAFQSEGPRVANPLPVHPTLTPEERFKLAEHAAKIFNRDDAPRGRLRRLRLSQLRSIQPTVDAETVRSYTHRRKPLKVAKVQGHWTVLDGNHCAARCWHARDKHVAVEEFAVD